MIYAECHVIDMNTKKIKGKYSKSFDNRGDYNSWYAIVKKDYDTIINIMFYNPENKPGQKAVNDSKLLRVSRSLNEI
jgi:hypothetical protein